MFSLPDISPSLDLAARFAITLIAGIVLGEIAQRALRLPRIVGYVFGGLVVGPSVLNLIASANVPMLGAFVDIVLGLLVFELGSRVDLSWLRRNRGLAALSLVEAGLTFIAVAVLLRLMGISPQAAALVGAVAIVSSPSVIVRIVIELRARGPITERLLLHSAFNTAISIVTVKAVIALLDLERGSALIDVVAAPLYLIGGSILLGAVCGWLLALAFRLFSQREGDAFLLALAILVLVGAVAHLWRLSSPLALLFGGLLLRNRSKRLVLLPAHFGTAGGVLVVLLFVFTGVQLDMRALAAGGVVAFVLVVLRAVVKVGSTVALAPTTGLGFRKALWLGVALLPMSSLPIVLINDPAVQALAAGVEARPIVYAAVFLMELIGPVLCAFALRSVDEDQTVRLGGRRHA